MNVEIIYRSRKMTEHHITGVKGCRISHALISPEKESEIPSVLHNVVSAGFWTSYTNYSALLTDIPTQYWYLYMSN